MRTENRRQINGPKVNPVTTTSRNLTDADASSVKTNGRRGFLKEVSVGASMGAVAQGALSLTSSDAMAQTQGAWDKTFPKNPAVVQRKVAYTNRLGVRLVADLYLPKDLDGRRKHPALVVGHPFGGVKEQTAGLYAQTMAERGFVTLAHDASYAGESGGTPHFAASPDVYVEDFCAGVDFLGQQALVDRDRIGVLGVCASGGFALAAAQIDPRIKAVATSVMYDMGGVIRDGLGKTNTDDMRRGMLTAVSQQRWKEAAGAKPELHRLPYKLATDTPEVIREFFDYYRTPRGQHPRSDSATTLTGAPSFFLFRPFDHLRTVSPRPVLLVVGENAHSRYFSEDAYQLAAEPRELYIVKGAGHVDLYDRVNLIPFDKFTAFFQKHL
jgi:fermentation-respiration switch protein FrsA (DUF1100 family)